MEDNFLNCVCTLLDTLHRNRTISREQKELKTNAKPYIAVETI